MYNIQSAIAKPIYKPVLLENDAIIILGAVLDIQPTTPDIFVAKVCNGKSNESS